MIVARHLFVCSALWALWPGGAVFGQEVVGKSSTPGGAQPPATVIQATAIPLVPGAVVQGAPKQIIVAPGTGPNSPRGEEVHIQAEAIPIVPGTEPQGAPKSIINGNGGSSRPGTVIEAPPVQAVPAGANPPAPPPQTIPD